MRIAADTLHINPRLAAMIERATVRDASQRSSTTKIATAPAWHSEADLHRAIVAMLAVEMLPGVVFFHPANGEQRSKAAAGRLKGMGVVPGIPDLILIADGRAYGLEIKTDKGTLSPSQKQMAERFRRAGSEYELVRSVLAARDVLRRWQCVV